MVTSLKPKPTHVWPQDGLAYAAGRRMSHGGRVGHQDLKDAAAFLGVEIVGNGGDIKPSDLYLVGRNTGVKLLTCARVDERNWIESVENAYSYDIWECVLIK